ncbi:hypothetical protein GcM3_215007 [Golovinomyces cichoracearum]|uniref:Uncharacterized protein n=1 Tax=Golovinomyces cichoracearum TaxID=62708 RepID=A0A420H8T2_9PEZI|nr:hypothetical protein GcM3_215007 [Golovinomyces cichoracearum]
MNPLRGWILETVQGILERALLKLEGKAMPIYDSEIDWKWKIEDLSPRLRASKRVAQILQIEEQKQDCLYAIISDGNTRARARLMRNRVKDKRLAGMENNFENFLIEVKNSFLILENTSEYPGQLIIEFGEYKVQQKKQTERISKPAALWENKNVLATLKSLNSFASKAIRESEKDVLSPLTQVDLLPITGDLSDLSRERFASQVSEKSSKLPENEELFSKKPNLWNESLLDMLQPAKKNPPSVNNVKILSPDTENFMPPREQTGLSASLPPHNNLDSVEISSHKQKNYVAECNSSVTAAHQSSLILDIDQQQQLSENSPKILSRYTHIPSDQKELLDQDESWFQVEADPSNLIARLPLAVSEILHSFFSSQIPVPDEPTINHRSCNNSPKPFDQSHIPTCLPKVPQCIPHQYMHISRDQKDLLDKPEAWFQAGSDSSDLYAHIPLIISEEYASFLRPESPKSTRSLKTSQPNSEEEGDESESKFLDHNVCQELIFEDESSKPETKISIENKDNISQDKEEYISPEKRIFFDGVESLHSPSVSPELKDWPASAHEGSFAESRSESLDISCSLETQVMQKDDYKAHPTTVDEIQQNFYQKFKLTYPMYKGNRQVFTWALIYIQWLLLHKQVLDSELWDDFIRVLASEYPEYIRSGATPITGYNYYRNRNRQVLFNENLVAPETLQIGLSSLDSEEVNHYREVFRMEPKNLAQNRTTLRTFPETEIPTSSKMNYSLKPSGPINDTKFLENFQNYTIESNSKAILDKYREASAPPFLSSHHKTHMKKWHQFLLKRKASGVLEAIRPELGAKKRYCISRRKKCFD